MTQEPGRALPKYRQIAASLRARIEAGEFPVGAQLPSIAELQSAYGAAKGTVDEALSVLRKLHLVETQHGAGTFVLRERPDESEEQQLREQVAALRAEIAALTEQVKADAGLREVVERLQVNLIELYGKTGFDYPHEEEAGGVEADNGTAAHGKRA
jgi:DNA-binding GntR family transcriptional regulator